MRSITLSQLRNTGLWLPWFKAGETIFLYQRKRLIARIVPDPSFIKRPAIRSRLKSK